MVRSLSVNMLNVYNLCKDLFILAFYCIINL
jgi:hypothetical protein